MFRAGHSGPKRDPNVVKSGKGQGLKLFRKNEVGLKEEHTSKNQKFLRRNA